MKKQVKPDIMPAVLGLLGILGYGLRTALYATAVDAKGLLISFHPLELGLWLCSALAAGLTVWDARKLPQDTVKAETAVSLPAALGHILAAAGIVLTVLPGGGMGLTPVQKLWRFAGMACGPLLLWGGFQRARGEKSFFGIYAAVSVFFALHLVCHYQSWCADPQLQNYVFSFLGSLALMLFAYYRSALQVGSGKPRLLRLTGLLALYLCLTAASAGNTEPLLYLGCGLWAGSDTKAGEADASSGSGEKSPE